MRRHPLQILAGLVLVILAVSPISGATDWPGLRGPDFDGGVRDANLLRQGADSLALGWKKALGSGYSAVVVSDGRAVTMFADGEDDILAAFDAESGEEIWRYRTDATYPGHDGSHDGPLSTPLIAGGSVFGLSPRGQLFGVDFATGKERWKVDVVEEHGAQKPHYGFTSSPVLADGVLVVEIGAAEGKAIAGFDPANGSLLWAVGDDTVNYHSPIVATIGGRLQVVAAGEKNLFGIDPRSGAILWSHEHGGTGGGMGMSTIIPLPAGENRFLLLNKQDASTMVEVKKGKELDYEVKELWSTNFMKATFVTPVYHDGYIYGMSGRAFTCLDAETGEMKWRSREPGDGFPTLVGDQIVVITKPGGLYVVEASPEGYNELASLELFTEHSWSQVAYADGHLFARSMNELARIDISGGKAQASDAPAWLGRTEFGRFLGEVATATDKKAVVDAFLESQESFPIIEGTSVVHFVFRGEAVDVGIVGDMLGFRREDPMIRIEGTDLFYYSTRLEPDAAVTYGFIKDYEEPMADPLNPQAGSGLFGDVSWVAMPGRAHTRFIDEAPAAKQGSLETIEWTREAPEPEEGEEAKEPTTHTAEVYLPAGYSASGSRHYPVVYVTDGKEALEDASMKTVFDNLIGTVVEPLIAVFVMEEDAVSNVDPYMERLISEVVSRVDERFLTIPEAHGRAVVGVGSGGAAAVYAAFKHSDTFGLVGSQSPMWFVQTEAPIREAIRNATEGPLALYMDWGTYDMRSPHEAWGMVDENRELFALLRENGYRPAGGEIHEGFGWSCWGGHTDEMLAALFPAKRSARVMRGKE